LLQTITFCIVIHCRVLASVGARARFTFRPQTSSPDHDIIATLLDRLHERLRPCLSTRLVIRPGFQYRRLHLAAVNTWGIRVCRIIIVTVSICIPPPITFSIINFFITVIIINIAIILDPSFALSHSLSSSQVSVSTLLFPWLGSSSFPSQLLCGARCVAPDETSSQHTNRIA